MLRLKNPSVQTLGFPFKLVFGSLTPSTDHKGPLDLNFSCKEIVKMTVYCGLSTVYFNQERFFVVDI